MKLTFSMSLQSTINEKLGFSKKKVPLCLRFLPLLSEVPLHSDMAETQPVLDLIYSYTTYAGLLAECFKN